MHTDIYKQPIYSESDICNLYYKDPNRMLTNILCESEITIPEFLDLENVPKFIKYTDPKLSVNEFDAQNQQKWFIPEKYKNFDIAKYVLDLCNSEEELQRVGQELIMFYEREMFDLLIYLKYLVDTMRENNIVWGVGRGSSVSSFVLFLLGVHKINSLHYDLSIDEFLK